MPRRNKKPPLNSNGRGAWCYWCKRLLVATTGRGDTRATRDHLYPRSEGGTFKVWACIACNSLKGNMRPNEWRSFCAARPEWWKLYKGG